MIGETIRKLAIELDSRMGTTGSGDSCFLGNNYRAHPFDKTYFHNVRQINCARKIGFIDGGNQEILSAPNISIQLNRIYFNIFEGRKRVEVRKLPQYLEFISVTTVNFDNHTPHYKTQVFPVRNDFAEYLPNNEDLEFTPRDEPFALGRHMDISRVASMARRFAEWSYSKHVVSEELSAGDLMVMDGALKTRFTKEVPYSRDCYAAAKSNGIIYSGLAKTSRLVTTTGMSLLGAIRSIAVDSAIDGMWYYHPIADSLTPNHAAEMYVVRLHNQSQRVYRYDIHKEQAKSMNEDELMQILTQLTINSTDISFPGYPYGLIDADDNARVRQEEVETYRMIVLSEISRLGSWPKFMREIQAMDAHDVLDFLKGGIM